MNNVKSQIRDRTWIWIEQNSTYLLIQKQIRVWLRKSREGVLVKVSYKQRTRVNKKTKTNKQTYMLHRTWSQYAVIVPSYING